jgi:hypothetical protein
MTTFIKKISVKWGRLAGATVSYEALAHFASASRRCAGGERSSNGHGDY